MENVKDVELRDLGTCLIIWRRSSRPATKPHPWPTLHQGTLSPDICHRKRAGHRFAEVANVVETLRQRENAMKKPAHGLEMGVRSVCLPLGGLINPSSIPPTCRAVFKVHTSNNITPQGLEQFVAWTETIPPSAGIFLEGVFEPGSMCIILSSAYAVYSKLAGIRGYRLVTETSGRNLLTRNKPAVPYSPPSKEAVPYSPPSKENAPLAQPVLFSPGMERSNEDGGGFPYATVILFPVILCQPSGCLPTNQISPNSSLGGLSCLEVRSANR
ncbi:uncharacterized protein TRUGW13939_08925 [Talaromyces rugulosus]|uniref:Uncharacterized protein n=1 Tax=Talaromyces rugulosus TaxID=121627 RepID=A0A7H8R5W8_TALRU|nr:uncharacterized protein TRUGW13939_08925 [Talaromyces rugulosus]QKX61769.1 hypothetical protein TRUGW13939_08925 [Talaromyces rugulosus]